MAEPGLGVGVGDDPIARNRDRRTDERRDGGGRSAGTEA